MLQLLMLTTNMIRKDLNSQNQYDAGLALSALSCFISSDLARDLANDIMTLVSPLHSLLLVANRMYNYKQAGSWGEQISNNHRKPNNSTSQLQFLLNYRTSVGLCVIMV